MNSFDWKFLAILSGGPGVVAISLGAYVYPYQTFGYIGLWLISIGTSGVLFALLCSDSARRRTEKLGVLTRVSPMKMERSTFSAVMIGLLVVDMIWTIYLTPVMLSPPVQFCYGCNTEQFNILGAEINITASSVAFGLSDSGTRDVVLAYISVTGGSYINQAGSIPATTASSTICGATGGQATIPKSISCTLTVTFSGGNGAFVAGTAYSFKAVTTRGNTFPYTAVA